MKQMMLLVSYLFLMGTNLFGSVVPHQWLVCKDIWFGLFQSVLLCFHLAGILFRIRFSQFFFAAYGGNLFRILFSQHLLMPHLAGS